MRRSVFRYIASGALGLLVGCQPASQSAAPAGGQPPASTPAGASSAVVSPAPVVAAASPAAPAASPASSPAAKPAVAPASPAVSPVAAAAVSPVASPSAGPCQIVLGFAALRDQIGASSVGECVESERQIQGTNNSAQRTTNGAFFHRDIDNRNLFSNATQTWLNGPTGVVTRPNNQRFEWEGDRQMIEALRAGGHVIYFRHGATDPNQADTDPNNLANCATQRNLTDAGRAQAQTIGEAFRSLAIPIGQVLSSEYCRALEYSHLAFNAAQPEPSLDLTDPLSDQQKAASTETVKRLLSTAPAAGVNTILVSHSPNIRLAAGVDLPVEGEAVIFEVDSSGTSTLVTRVLATDWPVLAQALASP